MREVHFLKERDKIIGIFANKHIIEKYIKHIMHLNDRYKDEDFDLTMDIISGGSLYSPKNITEPSISHMTVSSTHEQERKFIIESYLVIDNDDLESMFGIENQYA